MLTCKDVAERASALVDGELSGWDTLQIRLHLAMCTGCARFIKQMRQTDQLAADVVEDGDLHLRGAEDARFAEILSTIRKEQPRQ